MLSAITLIPFYYKAQECIGLVCPLEQELKLIIHRIKGVKWCGRKLLVSATKQGNLPKDKRVLKERATLNSVPAEE